MSRAFVKESEPDAPVELPEKAVSTLRNLMTEQDFAAMRELRDGLKEELDRCAHTDDIHARTRIAELQRDIRYYSIRLGSAEVVKCPATDAVRFGHCVSFRDQDENHCVSKSSVRTRRTLVAEKSAGLHHWHGNLSEKAFRMSVPGARGGTPSRS